MQAKASRKAIALEKQKQSLVRRNKLSVWNKTNLTLTLTYMGTIKSHMKLKWTKPILS